MTIIRPEDKINDVKKEARLHQLYDILVKEWNGNPGFMTMHKLKKQTLHEMHLSHVGGLACDECVTRQLAWEMFFAAYALAKKEPNNGNV